MIFIGLGGNLQSPEFGPPESTLKAVLAALPEVGVTVVRRSGFWRSAPAPASDQPWYVNAVAEIATTFDAVALLAALHGLETRFGRVRRALNEARVVDLDLLDFHGLIRDVDQGPPELPHPRMAGRNFVLRPLAELAPDWRHPLTGMAIIKLIKNNSINDTSKLIH